MGYLEKLPCGCIVFGKDAVVDDEDRKYPIIINAECEKHGIEATFKKTLKETRTLLHQEHKEHLIRLKEICPDCEPFVNLIFKIMDEKKGLALAFCPKCGWKSKRDLQNRVIGGY